MQKKLTVGELKASLKGVPEDLVVEFTSDTEESGDIILEYARRVKYELPVGQKFDDTGETGVDYLKSTVIRTMMKRTKNAIHYNLSGGGYALYRVWPAARAGCVPG